MEETKPLGVGDSCEATPLPVSVRALLSRSKSTLQHAALTSRRRRRLLNNQQNIVSMSCRLSLAESTSKQIPVSCGFID